MIHKFADGLRNIVANLGTERDKAAHTTYAPNNFSPDQLNVMYRVSSLARDIVDLPAEDSVREWREWQTDQETVSVIEEEEKRLNLAKKLLTVRKRARLSGGAALFIGTGDSDLGQPLRPERIGKGGLRYVSVLHRRELSAGPIEQDPREPYHGKPQYYELLTGGDHVTIHPSRLVIFQGSEILDEAFAGHNHGWSDSVLERVVKDVTNLDATMGNIASLVFEAKVDVIGINGFNEGLRSGGKAYEDLVLTRASLAAKGKSINSALVMDKEDEYSQKSANFSNLPNLVDKFMVMVSAAAKIPVTLLFGTSPGGLNATGESDTRAYYDRVSVVQKLELEPELYILDECVIRSATGGRDKEIHYNWRPLWQPTAKEKAETGKTVAQTFEIMAHMGSIPEEALANGIVNAMTECGLAPGLEGDYKKFGGYQEPELNEGVDVSEFEQARSGERNEENDNF